MPSTRLWGVGYARGQSLSSIRADGPSACQVVLNELQAHALHHNAMLPKNTNCSEGSDKKKGPVRCERPLMRWSCGGSVCRTQFPSLANRRSVQNCSRPNKCGRSCCSWDVSATDAVVRWVKWAESFSFAVYVAAPRSLLQTGEFTN